MGSLSREGIRFRSRQTGKPAAGRPRAWRDEFDVSRPPDADERRYHQDVRRDRPRPPNGGPLTPDRRVSIFDVGDYIDENAGTAHDAITNRQAHRRTRFSALR